MPTRTRALVLVAALLAPAQASASIFDIYGFSARGTALAGAMTAAADDFTATYYNPAALTVRKQVHIGLGVDWIVPSLTVNTTRPDPDPPPRAPEQNVGIHMGAMAPMGGLIDNRLAIGVGLFHPTLQLTRVEAFDPVRPQFYLYQSLPDKLLIAPAAAFEVTPWLSAGVGLQVLALLEGTADMSVSVGSRRFTRRDLQVDVRNNWAPTLGLLVRPSRDVRIGASYRAALEFTYRLPVALDLEEIGTLTFDIGGTALYTPHQVSLGAAWRASPEWTAIAGFTLAMWSLAPDPSAHVSVSLRGEAVGREELLTLESVPVDLGARDILISRLAAEYALLPLLTLRGGWSYRPTPLPTPTGRTNYIDSPAHTLSLGASWTTADPTETKGLPVILELAAQLTWLTSREVVKRDPEDSVGSYTAGGVIGHLVFTMRHDL